MVSTSTLCSVAPSRVEESNQIGSIFGVKVLSYFPHNTSNSEFDAIQVCVILHVMYLMNLCAWV